MTRFGSAFCVAMALLVTSAFAAKADPPRTEQELQRRLREPNYARSSFYVALSGLYAIENSAKLSDEGEFISSWGLLARIGNRHNRWFATEISGVYVHDFEQGDDKFLAWGLAANERFYLTKSRVQPFATVGLGFLSVRASYSPASGGQAPSSTPGFSPRFGMGVEVHASESVAIVLDVAYYLTVGHNSGHDFITAGLGFQFN